MFKIITVQIKPIKFFLQYTNGKNKNNLHHYYLCTFPNPHEHYMVIGQKELTIICWTNQRGCKKIVSSQNLSNPFYD